MQEGRLAIGNRKASRLSEVRRQLSGSFASNHRKVSHDIVH